MSRPGVAYGLLHGYSPMIRALACAVLCVVSLAAGAESIDVPGVSRLSGRPVSDAVIWLDAPASTRRARTEPAVLDQRNLKFMPRVLAVQVGTRVKFPNSDRVFHNVFSHHDGKIFDLGLYPVGAVKEVPFDRPGLSRVFCNIHPHMAAYVMVVDSPYFAVSDAEGAFMIRGVPPGSYVYHAWRPGGDILSDSVLVGPTTRLVVEWP